MFIRKIAPYPSVAALECFDLVELRQRIAQLIQAAKQTFLPVCIDLKAVWDSFTGPGIETD